LHQANQLKMCTAKEIGSQIKTIADLVAKLTIQRERLHGQVLAFLLRKVWYITFFCCVSVFACYLDVYKQL